MPVLRPAVRITYLLKIFGQNDWNPTLALASLHGVNVGYFATENKHAGYWYDTWGGSYDAMSTTDLRLFLGVWLAQVQSLATMLSTERSFWVNNDTVYFRVDKPAHSYKRLLSQVAGENLKAGYSTGARSEDAARNSDDAFVNEKGQLVRFPARLDIPSFSHKLTGGVGQVIKNTFSASYYNDDGVGDNLGAEAIPVRISKAIVENPALADFRVIADGVIEDVAVTQTSVKIKAASIFRSLDAAVCRTLSKQDFPTAEGRHLGKLLPVGWGQLNKVPLMEISDNKYIALDPLYIESISAVYDRDGKRISYSYANGIINSTEANSADVQAHNLRLGEIITSEISKAKIPYNADTWDKPETEQYSASSLYIAYSYKGKSVKDLVTQLLKNDLAYLIQKADGKFTLRRMLGQYWEWDCPTWLLTTWPEKRYSDVKSFASAVRTKYQPVGNKLSLDYFDGSREDQIYSRYKKKQTLEFSAFCDVQEAKRITADRYRYHGQRRERWKLSLGADLSAVSLLDTLKLRLEVNGRLLASCQTWRVLEIDPAQDTILLEESE